MYRCPPIVKLILYVKLQYNQINFMIDGNQCPPNLSVDRKVNLIFYIMEIDIRRSLISLDCIVLYILS